MLQNFISSKPKARAFPGTQVDLAQHARPPIKWAGGKSQILPEISKRYPQDFDTYIEPFLGGGAVFFDIQKRFDAKRFLLFDNNRELVLLYTVLRDDVEQVIDRLARFAEQYLPANHTERSEIYYRVRNEFNEGLKSIDFEKASPLWVERAARLVFLNKTGFNGLFRVNGKGLYNVPIGRYSKPPILDEVNLRAVSKALQKAEIHRFDFSKVLDYANRSTFIYYDPPYRPLSKTAYFTSYTSTDFNDDEQRRLAQVFWEAHRLGSKQLLSNSDPKNINSNDNFFDDLYSPFTIDRITATRAINSNSEKRGRITELLVYN